VNTIIVGLLAQEPNRGPDFGKAAPLGLLIVVLLLVGTFLLVWSMNRHLRKVPKSFDQDTAEPEQATDDGTAESLGGEPDAPTDGTKREPGG
jgi:hypothetical protein